MEQMQPTKNVFRASMMQQRDEVEVIEASPNLDAGQVPSEGIPAPKQSWASRRWITGILSMAGIGLFLALCVFKKDDSVPIGLDFGTTSTCVGTYNEDRVQIIANEAGNRTTPSFFALTTEGQWVVGEAAKILLTTSPANTVVDAKRLLEGPNTVNPVQHDLKMFPFRVVVKNRKPHIAIKFGWTLALYTYEDVSAMLILKMQKYVEAYTGKKVIKAVMTVPPYFSDVQRQATKTAGGIAGLKIVRIISEPIAASLAYGLDKKEGSRNVLVFHLGGSSSYVSLVAIRRGVFEILATIADNTLGGDDFDRRIVDHFIRLYKNKHGKDIVNDKMAIQRLHREVEKAKRVLSSVPETRIYMESFFEGNDFNEILTRTKLEELNRDLFHLTIKLVPKALDFVDLTNKDVHEIVLIGGSNRIPKIRELLKSYFKGKEPLRGIPPDETVAYGAAVLAGRLQRNGKEDEGGENVVQRGKIHRIIWDKKLYQQETTEVYVSEDDESARHTDEL